MSQIIVVDCDGVLTDGKVWYASSGSRQKQFHSRDITAIKRLIAVDYVVWIVSKSSWEGLKHFAKRTGAKYCTGVKDKAEWAIQELKGDSFIAVCDDYDDIELCSMAKEVFMPNNAGLWLKNWAWDKHIDHFVTDTPGGCGVMEEVEMCLAQSRKPAKK